MTQANHYPMNQNDLISLPSITLSYFPPVPTPGDTLEIHLKKDGEFAPNSKLIVALLSQTGERLISLKINSSDQVANLTIPNDCSEGTYSLQIFYQNTLLDTTSIDVCEDKDYAQQTTNFVEGLDLEDQVKQKIEEGDYEEAINLQKKVEISYNHNPKLAAKSWEELAEFSCESAKVFYTKEKIMLSKDCLDKSLTIYSGIEGLENKEELINRVKEKIEIVDHALDTSPKVISNIESLRKEKGYSQHQLAILVGVTPDIIQAWEQEKGWENLISFFEIAQTLNCSIDELIEINEDFYKKRTIKSNIRNLREKHKLTQHNLAISVGVTDEEIKKWEELQVLEELEQYIYIELAEVLNCKLSDLIDYSDVPVPVVDHPSQASEILPRAKDS